ncbi:MAG: hypothetical protein R3320_09385, partial [Nitriliruptorales bacterium]|nr:hypothetical protein [Nitriliruptorales bacterium]
PQSVDELQSKFDDLLILQTPRGFRAVGSWYRDFGQTSDEEVVEDLETYGRRAEDRHGGSAGEE